MAIGDGDLEIIGIHLTPIILDGIILGVTMVSMVDLVDITVITMDMAGTMAMVMVIHIMGMAIIMVTGTEIGWDTATKIKIMMKQIDVKLQIITVIIV